MKPRIQTPYGSLTIVGSLLPKKSARCVRRSSAPSRQATRRSVRLFGGAVLSPVALLCPALRQSAARNVTRFGQPKGAAACDRRSAEPAERTTTLIAIAASQRARHFAQMRRIVGIEATPKRHRLDGPISRDEHDHRIAHRVTVADPG